MLGRQCEATFLDFATNGLEDIFEMYPFRPPMRPWGCQSAQFREYVTLRVMVGMLAMLHTNPAGMDARGECLRYWRRNGMTAGVRSMSRRELGVKTVAGPGQGAGSGRRSHGLGGRGRAHRDISPDCKRTPSNSESNPQR